MSDESPESEPRLRFPDAFDEWANGVSDAEEEWWPFQFLRPDEQERMSSIAVLWLSILSTVPAALVASLLGYARGDRPTGVDLALVTLAASGVFFVAYRLTFAAAWNRRAARLTRAARRPGPK